tara:strand:+ start:1131 stop:1628 length:498 start_codon:yes stop_codon:yes gene_type:complete
MTKSPKKNLYLILVSFFLISCGFEEKVKEKFDEIDEEFLEISGTLSHNDSNISVGIVFLLEGKISLDIDELNLDLDDLELSNGSISLFDGKYTIFDVEEGEYYIVAIEDNNTNLEYDANIDRVGVYGFNLYDFDPIPNTVIVDSNDVENINIDYFFHLESPIINF